MTCEDACTNANTDRSCPSFCCKAWKPLGWPQVQSLGCVLHVGGFGQRGLFAVRTDEISARCAPERVTHASSIKRMEGDQVARQLRAAIVHEDKSGLESAPSSPFFYFLVFLPSLFLHLHFSLTHTNVLFFWSRHPPLPQTSAWVFGRERSDDGEQEGWKGDERERERE